MWHQQNTVFISCVFRQPETICLNFAYLIYIVTLKDNFVQCSDRIKYLFCFIFSNEICFSLGAQYSLKSKYSRDGDSPLFTKRVFNGFHFMLVSVPQILCVPVQGLASGYFGVIGTLSLLFSCLFIIWSVVYFFICNCYEDDFNNEVNNMIWYDLFFHKK